MLILAALIFASNHVISRHLNDVLPPFGTAFWRFTIGGLIMLPIAYVSWFILQNSRGLLGDDLPRGASAVRWNIAMAVAVTVTLVSVGYMLWTRFVA